jgi:hypothetical protein
MLLWKSNQYYTICVCVCNLSYSACKAHARYYIVICGQVGCTIFFPYYLINGTTIRKKRFLTFSITFVLNISHSKKTVSRYCHKYHMSICILVRLQWHLILLERVSKNQIVQWESTYSMQTKGRTDGRTDGHDELTVAFHNFANAPNNSSIMLI